MPCSSLVKPLMPTLAGHEAFLYAEQAMVGAEVLQITKVTEQQEVQEVAVSMEIKEEMEEQEEIMEAQEAQEEMEVFPNLRVCTTMRAVWTPWAGSSHQGKHHIM